jgi:hypothetical protein
MGAATPTASIWGALILSERVPQAVYNLRKRASIAFDPIHGDPFIAQAGELELNGTGTLRGRQRTVAVLAIHVRQFGGNAHIRCPCPKT